MEEIERMHFVSGLSFYADNRKCSGFQMSGYESKGDVKATIGMIDEIDVALNLAPTIEYDFMLFRNFTNNHPDVSTIKTRSSPKYSIHDFGV